MFSEPSEKNRDTLSAEKRSWNMSRIRSRDTKPERVLRSALHHQGLRFRLHRKDLPGTPDIVFPKHRLVVFVHGCFWHQHPGCANATMPTHNRDFWAKKLRGNVERDDRQVRELERVGWQVIITWECEIRAEITSVVQRILDQIDRTVTGHQVAAEGDVPYGSE